MTEDFKKILDEDISRCDLEINSGSKESRYNLHGILISKYGSIITDFDKKLRDLFYDHDGSYCKLNIESMKEKLILFKAMGYQNLYAKSETSEINIHNTNKLSSTINVDFSDVKKQVEGMTSLRDEDIEEIHSKIDEIEKIINSSERKTKKWEMAKEIVKWIADKGVDVAVALLPLILKLGE